MPHCIEKIFDIWFPQERHVNDIRHMFKAIKFWFRRCRFREGITLSRFIACDVRRDIRIVSVAKIEEGIITGQVRTTNVLYLSKGLIPQPEYETPREIRIDDMWRWTGQRWGGLPNGKSIVEQFDGSEHDWSLFSLTDSHKCHFLTQVKKAKPTHRGLSALIRKKLQRRHSKILFGWLHLPKNFIFHNVEGWTGELQSGHPSWMSMGELILPKSAFQGILQLI